MNKPESFVINSDFATLKNDAQATTSVAFPAGTVIPDSGTFTAYSDVIVGRQGAIQRVRIRSSRIGAEYYQCNTLSSGQVGNNVTIGAVGITVYAYVARINPTTVRCYVACINPATGDTTATESDTFTFVINTFIPPF